MDMILLHRYIYIYKLNLMKYFVKIYELSLNRSMNGVTILTILY